MIKNRLLSLVAVTAVALVAMAAGRSYFSRQEMGPQPTKEHQHLMKGVGDWEGTMTMFGMGPEPMKSEAHETVEAIGGFWLISRFRCDFAGTPFEGSAVTGYDPKKKKYVGTWIDSMSNYITVMEGDFDEATRTLTMHFMGPHPQTQEPTKHRIVSRYGDDDYKSEFFVGEGDEAFKSMTLEMRRKPAPAGEKAEEKGSR